MLPDGGELLVGQPARLPQDGIGNADLADIMQQGGDFRRMLRFRV